MATVGGYSVDVLRGLVPALKEAIAVWDVPGLDGHGAQQVGYRSPVASLLAISLVADNATANTLISNLESLQGTSVTIVDDHGDTYTNCLVVTVDTSNAKKAAIVDGASGYRVAVRLDVMRVA